MRSVYLSDILADVLAQGLNILSQEAKNEGGFRRLGGIGRLLGHQKFLHW